MHTFSFRHLRRPHGWRWLLPFLLVILFLSALLWLPWQAQQIEVSERREQLIADTLWVEQTLRFQLARTEEGLRLVGSEITNGTLTPQKFRMRTEPLIRNNSELVRIVWLNADGELVTSTDGEPTLLHTLAKNDRLAADSARKSKTPFYSQPEALPGFTEPILMGYYVPLFVNDTFKGYLIATMEVTNLLEKMVPWWFAQDNEITLTDVDDNILDQRASGGPGRGVYTHRRALDLPGTVITLRTNSIRGKPKLLPNLLMGSVILLSIGLAWSLWALWRDINRRIAAEGALRQQVAFRTAMENSLLTGLRARDLEGRVTYVNPAFCQMVGLPAEQLIGLLPPMPYWAPDVMEVYQERFAQVLAGRVTPQFETIFQRADGERIPVLIFESPLVDGDGKQTGWMGSILDISERQRAEDMYRQQQEKLQASARLASMGEIASTLAHELNQPLAAISSYTTGALNLINNAANQPVDIALLKPALEKAGVQAQRAGHIIRSVHAFVKKREPAREAVALQTLIDGLIPLVELQAQQFFVTIRTSIDRTLPSVLADQVLLEQVLLNLTRNAIEAMQHVPLKQRILHIVAVLDREPTTPCVTVSIIDCGHGISAETAERLFSPFFSTKAEGMGMGLNICRTAIEFHGGTLTHADNPQGGTIFRFSLPALLKNRPRTTTKAAE